MGRGSAGSLWVPATFRVLSSSMVISLPFSCLFPVQCGFFVTPTPTGPRRRKSLNFLVKYFHFLRHVLLLSLFPKGTPLGSSPVEECFGLKKTWEEYGNLVANIGPRAWEPGYLSLILCHCPLKDFCKGKHSGQRTNKDTGWLPREPRGEEADLPVGLVEGPTRDI